MKVSVFSCFSFRPCTRQCSAVLWCTTLHLAARATVPCSGWEGGSVVICKVKLKSILWITVDMGMRLAWIAVESVGDVLIAPVIVNAAECCICVIFFAMP